MIIRSLKVYYKKYIRSPQEDCKKFIRTIVKAMLDNFLQANKYLAGKNAHLDIKQLSSDFFLLSTCFENRIFTGSKYSSCSLLFLLSLVILLSHLLLPWLSLMLFVSSQFVFLALALTLTLGVASTDAFCSCFFLALPLAFCSHACCCC
jgi:hypothetical protein